MTIKLVLGKEERLMSTDVGIPRVGDTVEFTPTQLAKVVDVTWNLYGAEPHYRIGYITHQAVIVLARRRRPTKPSKYFPPQTLIDIGRNRKVEVTMTKEKRGRVPGDVWNSGNQRFEDRTTGRPSPAGSSPALRIACSVCGVAAGADCRKFRGHRGPDGSGRVPTSAHKRRCEEEERTR